MIYSESENKNFKILSNNTWQDSLYSMPYGRGIDIYGFGLAPKFHFVDVATGTRVSFATSITSRISMDLTGEGSARSRILTIQTALFTAQLAWKVTRGSSK